MTKWFLSLLYLYITAIVFTAILRGDFAWGLILFPMLYFPFYAGALLPAYTYQVNIEIQLYADLITLAFCLIGLAFPVYLAFFTDYLDLLETFFAALPFTIPAIKTIHRRAVGY